jgi:zinc transport system ATP-binding protein
MMSDVLLKIKNVSAGYDQKAVIKDINLTVCEQDFIGIIGPNGGGKTTLVKTILGQIQPLSGHLETKPGIKTGYLPQINKTDRDFPITVLDVVRSGFGSQKMKRSHQLAKAMELIELAGLTKYVSKTIGELSGGQIQRAHLCRALITEPELLILDEPNTFVDKHFEDDLYQLLHDLNNQMAILLVSHDIGTISTVVKTIACVNGGLHYHPSNNISNEVLQSYNCPIEIITHGTVPHRVLKHHTHND